MADIFSQVDSIFSKWDSKESPGCVLGIIQDGKFLYKRGYGMANLEHDVPLSPQSVLDIGSTSKQFTALCILLLARQGKLSLEDRIQTHIPEMPEYEKPITVNHLVHHTSGIPDYLELMFLAGMPFENDYQEPEIISLIARQTSLNFPPGDEFLYSNSGYFLMGEIVKRVSGKNLRDFAEENIFKPLQMKNTHFHNNFKEIVRQRASAYSPGENGKYRIDMGIFDVLGDGALYTSLEDLLLWDRNYYQNRLDGGGQDLIRQMEEKFTLNSGKEIDYAFGLDVTTYHGKKIVRHAGAWYGYRAEMIRFPEDNFGVICLSNYSAINPRDLALKVADLFLGDQHGITKEKQLSEDIQIPEKALETFSGFFCNEKKTLNLEISPLENQLSVLYRGETILFNPVSENSFKSIDFPYPATITFLDSDEKSKPEFEFSIPTAKISERLSKYEITRLSGEDLADYCGVYYQDSLNVKYEICVQDQGLQILIKQSPAFNLQQISLNTFYTEYFTVEFTFDKDNKPDGFDILGNRARRMRFDRIK